MKILVVGSGGREHALVKALSKEATVLAAPGNPGIAEEAPCFAIAPKDFPAILDLCRTEQVDLVVVGPEDPLVEGLGDFLREAGLAVYGPNKDGARLEASKAFSKELMLEAGIPTAKAGIFTDPSLAKAYAETEFSEGRPVVIKADGNALGKGVVVADTLEEAIQAIDEMMVQRIFGEAGATLVLESRLVGREFSLLTLCNGEEFLSLPVAQDHKRIFDGDKGPNTGGMGTYSPVQWVTPEIVRRTEESVVRPLLNALRQRGIEYRGTLFSGLMLTDEGIYCLEYNVRFGDPETQSVLARVKGGLAEALAACAHAQPIPPIAISDKVAVTVVLASRGYPASSSKGDEITIGDVPGECEILHAGTARSGESLVTNGGRVLGVTALGATMNEATEKAYQAVANIHFEGMQFRRDIGKQA